MTQEIYGITPLSDSVLEYLGASGQLPGALNMSVGMLLNISQGEDGTSAEWGVSGAGVGWRLRISRQAIANIDNGGLDLIKVEAFSNAEVITARVAAAMGHWLLVSYTLQDNDGTQALTLYVNGQAVFRDDTMGPITPFVGQPFLFASESAVISAVFYTEQTLTPQQISRLAYLAQRESITSTPAVPLDHLYNAARSMRPVFTATQQFLDTGTLATPLSALTPDDAVSIGAVLAGDFGQAVISLSDGTLPPPVLT